MISPKPLAILLPLMLAACMDASDSPQLVPADPDQGIFECQGKITSPAVIQTVKSDVLVQAAQMNSDGTIAFPAIYKSETRQEIVVPRKVTTFPALCEPQLTVELVSSLQRAMSARGLFGGAISGRMDQATRAAILSYQRGYGLESDILAKRTAQELGLVITRL